MVSVKSDDTFAEHFFLALPGVSRWVGVLDGFFDETGTHGDAELTGVAGFLFDKDGLQRFNEEWSKLTESLNKPFRTAECVSQRGPFETWRRDDCLRLLRDLAHLIVRTREAGFVSTVSQADFNEYAAANPIIRRLVHTPYSLCLVSCAQLMGSYAKEKGDEVHFWFEAGNEYEKEAADFMRRMRRSDVLKERHAVGGYAFIPKERDAALCSADFLAWEWQRQRKEIDQGSGVWREMFEIIRSDKAHALQIRHLTATSIAIHGLINAFYRVHAD